MDVIDKLKDLQDKNNNPAIPAAIAEITNLRAALQQIIQNSLPLTVVHSLAVAALEQNT